VEVEVECEGLRDAIVSLKITVHGYLDDGVAFDLHHILEDDRGRVRDEGMVAEVFDCGVSFESLAFVDYDAVWGEAGVELIAVLVVYRFEKCDEFCWQAGWEGHIDGFFGKAVVDFDVLERCNALLLPRLKQDYIY